MAKLHNCYLQILARSLSIQADTSPAAKAVADTESSALEGIIAKYNISAADKQGKFRRKECFRRHVQASPLHAQPSSTGDTATSSKQLPNASSAQSTTCLPCHCLCQQGH